MEAPPESPKELSFRLEDVSTAIEAEVLQSFTQLPEKKRRRALIDIEKLHERQLLNTASFREAIERVSVPIEPVKKVVADVKDVKDRESNFDKSLKIHDGPSLTYLRMLECDFEGDLIPTQVFEGYDADDKTRVSFCVKESLKQDIRAVSKEAKYNRFVYGVGMWFQHKNSAIVLNPWQHGEVLCHETEKNIDFKDYDPKRRIKWIASGLKKIKNAASAKAFSR